MGEDSLKVISGDNSRYAKLIVPTQREDVSISQRGASLGNDTFSEASSDRSIKQNPFIEYISRLHIQEDYIEIGLLLHTKNFKHTKSAAKKGVSPTIRLRISFSKITEVYNDEIENYPGIIFETEADIFKIKFAPKQIAGPVNHAYRNMNDRINQHSIKTDSPGSIANELEKLARLHEEGELSEHEFKKAKRRLLSDN